MFGKFGDAFNLLRKGSEVADKSTWKDVGTATPYVASAIMAALKLAGDFGWVNVQLTTEEATTVAAGVSTAVLYVIHLVTSKHAGIMPAKQPAPIVSETVGSFSDKSLPVVNTSADRNSEIDDDTRKRAEQYVRDNLYNG